MRQQQLEELQALAEAKQYETLIERLGFDLLEPLAAQLPAAAAYGLGHWAYEHERFEVVVPLLLAVVAKGEQAGDLLPWAMLFLGLSHRGLGEVGRAREQLGELRAQRPGHDANLHGEVALAWLDLSAGAPQEANSVLEQLRSHPQAGSNLIELDLLGRVLSTLAWLENHSRDQLGHAVDRAGSDGVVAAIDHIRLSRCGRMLEVLGWFVDPGNQLRELFLVRGERVWRLNLGQARYTDRPDLSEVVARCGGDANQHSGLTLLQISLADEAVPLQGGEAAELFAVLANGSQFCLRRTLETTEVCTEQIKRVLDAAIQEPCRLVSANLLHRARAIWGAELLRKLNRPAEHLLFGVPPTEPELSVVVPLYGRIDFMEYQLNWFNAWHRRKGQTRLPLQLIYVLDDPRHKQECVALAKRCDTLYRQPFELVINGDNLGFAGANNRGAGFAIAPLMLLLNSDVLPAHDESLELMLRAMQQRPSQIGALGARLLYDNGAIQHQGMTFTKEPDLEGEIGRVWLNEHPLKGVKVQLAREEASTLIEVEAVTAACLMIERDRFEQIGGLSPEYIVGDFEDSDLCLSLRSLGLPILLDHAATFYHLERQSVGLASCNDGMEAKLVASNAITHHQRWCSVIERLQQSGLQR
ncbi:MAG: glycosyltransferase family 2 protein [Cyanobacteriota bacterium]